MSDLTLAPDDRFDEDIRLVERFCSGDQEAFQQIYEKYYDRLFKIAKGILLNAEDAADAVQEIFTLIYRNLSRFDRRSKLSTWMFRIAVNRSIQSGRSLKYRTRQVELNAASEHPARPEPEPMDPAIEVAMRKLQPGDRAIMILFYWDDLSLQEIADSLGIAMNAAKTRLFRARERFKQFYEAEA